MRAKEGAIDVMIGPRSALFTPFANLGLIVIDEEHESTYKSEQIPRYHARETAVERPIRISGRKLERLPLLVQIQEKQNIPAQIHLVFLHIFQAVRGLFGDVYLHHCYQHDSAHPDCQEE